MVLKTPEARPAFRQREAHHLVVVGDMKNPKESSIHMRNTTTAEKPRVGQSKAKTKEHNAAESMANRTAARGYLSISACPGPTAL
jgi:hypothetical protein